MAENNQNFTQSFSADKPCLPENDAFYRLPFAKKIAETITKRDPQESIVIGISGAWGEGKTTVQDYIYSEIKTIEPSCIQIKFSQWRIQSDDDVFVNFFNEVKKEIDNSSDSPNDQESKENDLPVKKQLDSSWRSKFTKKIKIFSKEDDPYHTSSERRWSQAAVLGQKVQGIPVLENVGTVLKNVGENYTILTIDKKKPRLIDALKDIKKRTIIYIDDIDRLEANEIRYVFRLVKSTCDFPNLTYILFFDRNAVVAALNSTANNSESNIDGERYLEKIIQIPFDLPKIQKENLEKFFFEQIDKVLKSIDIELAQEEHYRYKTNIKPILKYKIATPRSILLYVNVLSFGLNFLKSDVNIVDFMIVEALRLFYPNCYRLIKENPQFFIGIQLDSMYWFGQEGVKSQEYKSRLSAAMAQMDEFEKTDLDSLITNLFPSRLVPERNTSPITRLQDLTFFKNKRIASLDYFERYFSYSTLNNTSDNDLENSLMSFFHKNDSKSIENMIEIQPGRFVKFIHANESNFDLEKLAKLVKLLSRSYSNFVNINTNSSGISHRSDVENTVLGLIFLFLLRVNDQGFLLEVINDNSSNLRFLLMLRMYIVSEDTFLSVDEIKGFNKVILDIVKKEITLRNSLFEIRPQYLISWLHDYLPKFDAEFYRTQVMDFLDKSQSSIEFFFVTLLQTETGYLHDFFDNKYKALSEIFNMSYIYAKILEHTPKNEITNTQVQWRTKYTLQDYNITNIFRQFMSHYSEDVSNRPEGDNQ